MRVRVVRPRPARFISQAQDQFKWPVTDGGRLECFAFCLNQNELSSRPTRMYPGRAGTSLCRCPDGSRIVADATFRDDNRFLIQAERNPLQIDGSVKMVTA
jgi:hypothetical protein